MRGFERVLRRPCRKSLARAAEILYVWITQDADGNTQMWDEMPKMNVKQGYWEIPGKDSVLLVQVSKPYCTDWKKSLITPHSYSVRGVISE